MAVLRLHVASSYPCHVMKAAYSCEGAGASLNCSIYYEFLCELPRMPKRRSSQNFYSPALGEKGPVGREEGVSVPDRVIASIVHGRGPLVL